MIGVYMRPDRTQIIKAAKKKNKNLQISMTETMFSYLDAIKQNDVEKLTEMFLEIKAITPTFSEEIYLVLPDTMFYAIDCKCFKNTTDQELEKRQMHDVLNHMKADIETAYISVPIECKDSTEVRKTIYVMEQQVINLLSEAAKLADVALVSVEAASFAYFRSVQQWNKEQYLIELFQNESCIISYSPVGGIFRYDCSEFAIENLENQDIEAKMLAAIDQNDMIAKDTFAIINVDSPIQILSDNEKIFSCLSDIKHRLLPTVNFPENIESDLLEADQFEWMIPLGAILQAETLEDGIYASKPDFIYLTDNNLLPESVRKRSRFQRLQKLAKKYAKILIVVFSIIAGIEAGFLLYASTVTIPTNLQNEYQKAKGEFDNVKKELAIITQAKSDDQKPLTALEILLTQKPQNLGFSEIEIGARNVDKNAKKWISFTAKSNDPMIIRDYANRLADDSRLSNISIEQITSDNNIAGLKTGMVVIGKGKVD